MTTDPTRAEMQALLAEYRIAMRADDSPAADARHRELHQKVMSARPTDPAAMALQLRWLADYMLDDGQEIVLHAADQLETLAGRMQP